MKLQPLNDRIIVKRTEEEDVTKGGIIIPDSAKEKPIQGKILAVGTGKVMDDGSKLPLDVKKGDTVLFSRYAGSEVKIEGEDLLIMREDDVLAVIEKQAAGRVNLLKPIHDKIPKNSAILRQILSHDLNHALLRRMKKGIRQKKEGV